MRLVVLARFHFDRKHLSLCFDDKIQFASLLIIVVIGRKSMSHQFLYNCIFVYGTEINILIALDYPQLDTLCIPGCK